MSTGTQLLLPLLHVPFAPFLSTNTIGLTDFPAAEFHVFCVRGSSIQSYISHDDCEQ